MLSVAGGQSTQFKSQEVELVEVLESILARIKSGDILANGFVLVLNDNQVDSFTPSVHYFCRATLAIALLEIAKQSVLSDTGII